MVIIGINDHDIAQVHVIRDYRDCNFVLAPSIYLAYYIFSILKLVVLAQPIHLTSYILRLVYLCTFLARYVILNHQKIMSIDV